MLYAEISILPTGSGPLYTDILSRQLGFLIARTRARSAGLAMIVTTIPDL